MELRMSVFRDWLKEFEPVAEIWEDAMEINTVRLLSTGAERKDNCIYVGRMGDFYKTDEKRVLCVHKNDIMILNTGDLDEVINSILNAFEFYSKWDSRLLYLLGTESLLQDFLDETEGVLNRPIFILDAGQRHLAMSRQYGFGSVDILWDELKKDGSANLKTLVEINKTGADRFKLKDMYVMDREMGIPNHAYNYNFHVNEKWVGKICMIDKDNNITEGEVCLFLLLCQRLGKWFETHIQETNDLQIDHLLVKALDNKKQDNKELMRLLNLNGWGESDTLILVNLGATYQPFNINNHLCRTLNHRFDSIYAVNYRYGICLFCNITMQPKAKLLQELQPWLSTGRYYGVISGEFSMKDSIYENYVRTDITNQYCEKKVGELYEAKDYALKCMLHEISKQAAGDLMHPAIQRLVDYDRKHQTELTETLRVFLNMERSNIKTAEALNLHRNSLSYRINKIRELLGVDLENSVERLHLMLSFEMMDV